MLEPKWRDTVSDLPQARRPAGGVHAPAIREPGFSTALWFQRTKNPTLIFAHADPTHTKLRSTQARRLRCVASCHVATLPSHSIPELSLHPAIWPGHVSAHGDSVPAHSPHPLISPGHVVCSLFTFRQHPDHSPARTRSVTDCTSPHLAPLPSHNAPPPPPFHSHHHPPPPITIHINK